MNILAALLYLVLGIFTICLPILIIITLLILIKYFKDKASE